MKIKIKNETTVSNRIKRHETTFDYDKIKNNNNNKKTYKYLNMNTTLNDL